MKPSGLISKCLNQAYVQAVPVETIRAIAARSSHWYFSTTAWEMVNNTDPDIREIEGEDWVEINVELPYPAMTIEVDCGECRRGLVLESDETGFHAYMFAESGAVRGFCGQFISTDKQVTIWDGFEWRPISTDDHSVEAFGWQVFLSSLARILECENVGTTYVKPGFTEKRKGRKRGAPQSYITLNLPNLSASVVGGADTGRTVRPHWRRGHIRNVKTRDGHIRRWIKPTLVNAGDGPTPSLPSYRPHTQEM